MLAIAQEQTQSNCGVLRTSRRIAGSYIAESLGPWACLQKASLLSLLQLLRPQVCDPSGRSRADGDNHTPGCVSSVLVRLGGSLWTADRPSPQSGLRRTQRSAASFCSRCPPVRHQAPAYITALKLSTLHFIPLFIDPFFFVAGSFLQAAGSSMCRSQRGH